MQCEGCEGKNCSCCTSRWSQMNSGAENLHEPSSVLREWAMRRKEIVEAKNVLMNDLDKWSQVSRTKNPAEFPPVPTVVREVHCALFLFSVLFQRDMCLFLCMTFTMTFEKPFPFVEPFFNSRTAGPHELNQKSMLWNITKQAPIDLKIGPQRSIVVCEFRTIKSRHWQNPSWDLHFFEWSLVVFSAQFWVIVLFATCVHISTQLNFWLWIDTTRAQHFHIAVWKRQSTGSKKNSLSEERTTTRGKRAFVRGKNKREQHSGFQRGPPP